MRISLFWHQFYLCSKQASYGYYCSLIVLCLFASQVLAQGHVVHLDDYDEQPVHYGFVLGMNNSRFQMITSDTYASNNILANTKPSWGFSVGLAATFQPTELLAIRLSPTAVFGQRIIDFKDLSTGTSTQKVIESTIAEFPLMLKIKSQRRHNARMFMLVGIKPSFSLSTRAAQELERVRTKTVGFALEYGFGFENFYPMFKFAPEIRFSHGIGNVLVADDNQFSNQIKSLTNHSVSIYLFFE